MSLATLSLERSAIAEVFRHPQTLLAQLAGNALLLAVFYGWLSLPDRSAWQLVLSASIGLAGLFAALWLHGASFASFHAGAPALPFRRVLKRLPRVLICCLLLVLLYWLTGWLRDYGAAFTNWLSSWLTATFRKPVSPNPLRSIYSSLVALIHVGGWLVVLPLISQASGGYPLRLAWRPLKRLRYWVGAVILAGAGYYAARLLVNWVPSGNGLVWETVSLVLRFATAYLWATTAWLALAAWTARFLRETGVEPA